MHADSEHMKYVDAVKNSFKSGVTVDSEKRDALYPTPVSEIALKSSVSYIIREFNKLSKKFDDHIQNQLYILPNVQNTPMELSKYFSQETGTGVSLLEV